MNEITLKQKFFNNILVHWLGFFVFLIPLAFCFYTYDSAQIKTTLFYICSCGVFFIWISSLISCGQNILTKKNFYTLLPILLYAFYILLSYFLKPYRLVRFDNFLHEVFCLALFLPIAFSLKEENFKIILNYCFASAWLAFGYGLLQFFKLDFLPWKSFFADSVFSFLANPNLFGSYTLVIAVLVFFSYLIKPQRNLIILFILAIVNLALSRSKGSYFTFAVMVLLGSTFFLYFFWDKYKKNKNKIIAVSLVLMLIAGSAIFYLGSKRIESFSFRLATWRSCLDMVQASPLTGTGIGSFEIIYPAYKRPIIFYIENNSAAMTQHAENYYLEQLATLGFLGFGLFIWVLFYVLKQVLFKLKLWAKDKRQQAYILAGFTLASLAIYIHSLVDVTTYFASTCFLLILFNGIIFNLAFGPFENKEMSLKNDNKVIFQITFVLALLILGVIYFYIQKVFWTEIFISSANNLLQILYCVSFIFISFAILSLFVLIMLKTKKVLVCLAMILAGIFYFLFWQQFISNINFSRATGYAEKGRLEALNYYTKVIKQNPTFYPAWHFRGLFLLNRFSLIDRYDPQAGDGKGKISNDFKRALRDFNKTKELAPNAALLDYNIASLYLKYADEETNLNKKIELCNLAEDILIKALFLDPSNENIYYQLANIGLFRGSKIRAAFWIDQYLQGPKDISNPNYLKLHRENKKALQIFKNLGGQI